MFTGIIEEIGQVKTVRRGGRSAVLAISAPLITTGLNIGDSVAVNGVCLTATAITGGSFSADAMPETLSRSTLGSLAPGSRVNLERAMAANGRFGGHIVSGHIDGTAKLTALRRDDNAIWCELAAEPRLLRYIIEKGSVAIDGVSLTVADLTPGGFAVSIIPHTAGMTTLGSRRVGDTLNLECDIIGKYVERLLSPATPAEGGVTAELLSKYGFM